MVVLPACLPLVPPLPPPCCPLSTKCPLALPHPALALLLPLLAPRVQVLRLKGVRPYIPDFKLAFEHFCVHTGGRGVIDAIEKQLELREEHVRASRETLYRYGNVSSSSVWCALHSSGPPVSVCIAGLCPRSLVETVIGKQAGTRAGGGDCQVVVVSSASRRCVSAWPRPANLPCLPACLALPLPLLPFLSPQVCAGQH